MGRPWTNHVERHRSHSVQRYRRLILTNKKGLDAFLDGARLPSIAGTYKGRSLVICGDAACVWDDFERFGCRSDEGRGSVSKPGFDFMMVNRIGEVFPGPIEHWYSNAGHLLTIFKAARRQEYSKEFPVRHTHSCQGGAEWQWPWNARGTSILGAALTGVALGYDQVMLCGAPLDDGPHNGEPPWRRTKFASSEATFDDWKRAIDLVLKGKVKSMSGRSREWL